MTPDVKKGEEDGEESDAEDYARQTGSVRVTRGVYKFDAKHTCCIFGDGGLEWLFSLRPQDWSRVWWIPHHGDASLLSFLVPQFGPTLTVCSWATIKDLKPEVWLGSGSNSELEAVVKNIPFGAPVILTTSIARGRSKNDFRWRSIDHREKWEE
jgi:hypothetical protein